MPGDPKTRPISTQTKPLTPTLSSNIRTRPAFAPRLAGAAAVFPLTTTHRNFREPILSPSRDLLEEGSVLSANITPRSGARNSRLETESPSTPDTIARVRGSQDTPGAEAEVGIGISTPSASPLLSSRPRSFDKLTTTIHPRRRSGANSPISAKDDTKFFRIDDVKDRPLTTRPAPLRAQTTVPTRSSSPKLSPRKPRFEDKFFRADDIGSSTSTSHARPIFASRLSNTSAVTAPVRSVAMDEPKVITRVGTIFGTERNPSAVNRPRATSSGTSVTNSALDRRRSSSLNLVPIVTEDEKMVDEPLDLVPVSTAYTEIEANRPGRPVTNQLSQPRDHETHDVGFQTGPLPEPAPSTVSRPESARVPLYSIHTRTPSDLTTTTSVTQAETAATARRERKVLDLEISNSSLLAINRTLERELKKQNAELRRFRRLSRSGRLSLTGHRLTSIGTLDALDEDGNTSIKLDNIQEDENSDLSDEDSQDTDENSSNMESIDVAKRRARDEKRLLLDLSRHQQLLIDSQKLTQSIQRCLNSTDQMVKEANRALSYNVAVGDVKLGGRVLDQDESDEDKLGLDRGHSQPVTHPAQTDGGHVADFVRPRQGLLSPSLDVTALHETVGWIDGLKGFETPDNTMVDNGGGHDIDTQNLNPIRGKKSGAADSPLKYAVTTTPSPTLSPMILPQG